MKTKILIVHALQFMNQFVAVMKKLTVTVVKPSVQELMNTRKESVINRFLCNIDQTELTISRFINTGFLTEPYIC